MVSERERDDLRAAMPELLAVRCGVTDVRRSFRCPSPEHDDSNPSAHYYADGQTVHCFGCGRTWDVFSLIGELDGIDGFPEQARAVAELVGYRLSDDDGGGPVRSPRARPKPRPPFEEPRAAGGADCIEQIGLAFGSLYAPGNEAGREWLRSRGLDDDDAARWGLGFTRDPREVMPEFRVRETGAAGFITIPFFTGRECSAANYCMVRTIPGSGAVRNKEWRPAGLVSPLWNEWMLSAALPVVYVAEGLIDAMALAKSTGKDVMALGGVAGARRFASVVFHTPAELRPGAVMVCMDEDAEGRKAADRMCADLDAMGVRHNVLPPYPGGAKDADEWLMAGSGVRWDFERYRTAAGGLELFRTRWRDGG